MGRVIRENHLRGRAAPRALRLTLISLALLAITVPLEACSSGAKRRPRASNPVTVNRDEPAILRGVVETTATLRGTESMLVSGYGVVVNLNGTGSADVPTGVRALMEREMTKKGVGSEVMGNGWTTPTRMLNDKNTAVVMVQAIIPPGAQAGTRVDVIVTALPGTSTTSIEGGRLWTTDLRAGLASPASPDTPVIATASGDIFINPFADPAQDGEDAINRSTGRVLDGAEVIKKRELFLMLDTPSHARAQSVVAAINSRFPRGPYDSTEVAVGRSEEAVEINTPRKYINDTEKFIPLMMATRIDQRFAQEHARRYIRALKESPGLAQPLSWRLEALGESAIPQLRDMYTYPEARPRLAALRAGARLGDALTIDPLIDLAENGPSAIRADAIGLLADADTSTEVSQALMRLVNQNEIDVRVAAYEALARRGDAAVRRQRVSGKFFLDQVESTNPMVYVSQIGEPRIVLFGTGAELSRPSLVFGWADRLMLASESALDPVRLYYRDYKTGQTTNTTIDPDLSRFIRFLGHDQTPEDPSPGLGLSYSEVVGALYEVWKGDGMNAGFVAEQDKVAAEMMNSMRRMFDADRPEFSEDELDETEFAQRQQDRSLGIDGEGDEDGEEEERRIYVVPLQGPKEPK